MSNLKQYQTRFEKASESKQDNIGHEKSELKSTSLGFSPENNFSIFRTGDYISRRSEALQPAIRQAMKQTI
jgi:hypothetical protein